MEQMLEAVFENGTFRLLEPSAVTLVDGQHVRLTVETEGTPDDILVLAERVYDGLSEEEIDDVERISLDRRTFFGDRTA
jgi:predicted DNA-binding antitoxin AbrB/MazE fold protein